MNFLTKIASKLKSSVGVGILFLASVSLLIYVSVRLTSKRIGGNEGTYTIYASVVDSAGLIAGTSIRSAGIKIGVIERISLDNQRAKIEMIIINSVKLYKNASLGIKSLGILGDKYLDINQGSSNYELLVDGDEIVVFRKLGNIEQIMGEINNILKDVRSITLSLKNTIGSETGENHLANILKNMDSITFSLHNTLDNIDRKSAGIINNLHDTLLNASDFSLALNETLAENRQGLAEITANLANISKTLNNDLPDLTGNLKGILQENRRNIKVSLDNLQEASWKLSGSLENLESATRKIDEGEGTIGKLVSDEQMGDDVKDTISGLKRFLGEANRIKLDLGVRMEYQPSAKETKGYLSLYYIPRREHYFIFQLVKDPRPAIERKIENVSVTTNSNTSVKRTITDTSVSKYLVSLQLAQRYYDSLLRFGLFEDKVGLGIDQYFGEFDQYKLTFEAFDFERKDEGAHLRLMANWRFLGNTYLAVGIDDLSNQETRYRQGFIGIGIDFNEDSLKLIGSSLPIGSLVGQ
ncbi:MAG: MCE family protein [SAR324 cluster bacterium]|nr:MCE family protein [SAR324 cluster bacterium]